MNYQTYSPMKGLSARERGEQAQLLHSIKRGCQRFVNYAANDVLDPASHLRKTKSTREHNGNQLACDLRPSYPGEQSFEGRLACNHVSQHSSDNRLNIFHGCENRECGDVIKGAWSVLRTIMQITRNYYIRSLCQ